MRRALLGALLVSGVGCYPPMDYNCLTEGGMMVSGGDCQAIGVMQRRIEVESKRLGLRRSLEKAYLYVRTQEVNERGGWIDGTHGSIAGLSHCGSSMMIVGVGTKTKGWEYTAFAHEAFHIMQNCAYDDKAPDPYHPYWDAEIYPALERINTDPAPMVAP